MDADEPPPSRETTSDRLYVIDDDAQRSLAVQKPWARNPHHFKRCGRLTELGIGRATPRRDARESSTDADAESCVNARAG